MLIIFDCDGVLINSEAILVDAELEFLAKKGMAFEKHDYMHTFTGLSYKDWRIKIENVAMDRTGISLSDEFYNSLNDYIETRFETELGPVSGVREIISNLSIQYCVASNTAPVSSLERKLELAGIADIFIPHLFSADMVVNAKPAPDLFLHAAKTMNFDTNRCIVVEDSSNGVKAAKAAGMKTIGFTGGDHCLPDHGTNLTTHGADIVISNFGELEEAIVQLI